LKFKTISSTNAYMLIYTLLGHDGTLDVYPPDHVEDMVQASNKQIELDLLEFEQKVEKEKGALTLKRKHYEEIWKNIIVPVGAAEYNWISTKWLREWIAGDDKQIDNKLITCTHACADPSKTSQMKRISREAWIKLYEYHGGGPELTSDQNCKSCIVNSCLEQSYNSAKKKAQIRYDKGHGLYPYS